MYAQNHFREERPEVLHAAIRDLRFGALVTAKADGIAATHLPLLLREDEGRLVLESHVAIQNSHWRDCAGASMAIFQGPQAYVSPGWYESKRQHGKVVPTWNYVAVHVTGALEAVTDGAWLARHLGELTDANEAGQELPWAITDAPADFIANLQRAIVGLRMTIDRIDGVWKMAQHRPVGDRLGTIAGLGQTSAAGSAEVAKIMRKLEDARS